MARASHLLEDQAKCAFDHALELNKHSHHTRQKTFHNVSIISHVVPLGGSTMAHIYTQNYTGSSCIMHGSHLPGLWA